MLIAFNLKKDLVAS